MAAAGGWSFLSYSQSGQASDRVCSNLEMARSAYETCQFRSAVYIRVFTFELLNPDKAGQITVPENEVNLSAADCAALKTGRRVSAQGQDVVAVFTPPRYRTSPCPKGMKRNSKGVCYTPLAKQSCSGDSELVCRPKTKI